jgi:hypothetical protein
LHSTYVECDPAVWGAANRQESRAPVFFGEQVTIFGVTLCIANGAGFLGDQIDAPRRLVEAARVDYLTLEYLAELTLSILARIREKDPSAGYANDFLRVLDSLLPALRSQPQLKIVTNAGGMNPTACAREAAARLCRAGLADVRVATVGGDDLLESIDSLLQTGIELRNLETDQPLAAIRQHVVSANAYLGAAPIVQALDQGARIVITGRVADAALTVAPAVHEFGWSWDDWNRLAGASVAGHLIECGAQVTGGYSTQWDRLPLADVGYPIAQLESDGRCVITKPPGSGGAVTRQTVVEQLVYEIGNPRHYLTPDVDVNFSTVQVNDLGNDRVEVMGATATSAPAAYKVSLAYRNGFTAAGQLLVFGTDCIEKASATAEIVRRRLEMADCRPDRFWAEVLGRGDSVPGLRLPCPASQACEVVLRIAVADARREVVERFTQEIAPLITSGPAGLAGYAAPRSPVRPVFAYWPTLVPKSLVTPRVEVQDAGGWQP